MGYRWDATPTEIWNQRNLRNPVWQLSHVDSDPWDPSGAELGIAAFESGFDMNEIAAIFMHPDTWAQYSAEVPEMPPFFVKETLEERLSTGWVATTVTGMFTPVYFFAGWKVRKDRVWIVWNLARGQTTRDSVNIRILSRPRIPPS